MYSFSLFILKQNGKGKKSILKKKKTLIDNLKNDIITPK